MSAVCLRRELAHCSSDWRLTATRFPRLFRRYVSQSPSQFSFSIVIESVSANRSIWPDAFVNSRAAALNGLLSAWP